LLFAVTTLFIDDLPNIRATKSWNVTRAGHLARIEAKRYAYRFFVRKTEQIGLLKYPDDVRPNHKDSEWEVVTGFFWLRIMTSDGLL
jgi:hypothetical protein